MTYVDGFVAAVPKANKEAYLRTARAGAKMFMAWGATRVVEAKEDEAIVFSWTEYPDKATRDAVQKQMMENPEMGAMQMPFDMGRMIYGGFETLLTTD